MCLYKNILISDFYNPSSSKWLLVTEQDTIMQRNNKMGNEK